MGIKEIIDNVLKAEGGSASTNDPVDGGGRTQFGISERANPEAWLDGKVTEEEAREIYLTRYYTQPGFDKLDDPKLQHFMVDFAVLSGPHLAIQYLQRAIGVPDDGILGPQTLAVVNGCDDRRVLVNRLVVERVKMIGRIVNRAPNQARFLNGWLSRALGFFQV